MLRATDHTAMPIAAYANEFHAAAGKKLSVHASSNAGQITNVIIERPAVGEGRQCLKWAFDVVEPDPGPQPIVTGSFAEFPLSLRGDWTFVFWVKVTHALPTTSLVSLAGEASVDVTLDGFQVTVATPTGAARQTSSLMRHDRWTLLAIAQATGRVSVTVAWENHHEAIPSIPVTLGSSPVLRLGAASNAEQEGGRLDGVVADPRLYDRRLREDEILSITRGAPLNGSAAEWRLSPNRPCPTVIPSVGNQADAIAVGHPIAGVLGPLATESVPTSWSADPSFFNALQLHAEDLDDCRWPVTHRIHVPDDAPSDLYIVTLTTDSGAIDSVPFFVVNHGADHSPLAFLAPTLTYLAYANERLPEAEYQQRCSDAGIDFARANDLLSQYDTYRDGQGVVHASARRPLATFRLTHRYPLSGTAHGVSLDVQLLRFCHEVGLGYEVLTDHWLDERGDAALDPYRVLMTGSHPEYWTPSMRQSLDRWLSRGGRLAYFGGNGLYWATAIDASDRAVSEVRRGPNGIKTWEAPPHQTRLTLVDHPGGLWRETHSPESTTLGVSTCAMGFSEGRAYQRSAASRTAANARFFEGCSSSRIGERGSVLGAAASYEIDAVPHSLEGVVDVLATASAFDQDFEVDCHANGPSSPRADMSIYRRPEGGQVFSVGSVGWVGALEDPNVAQVTENVLRSFLSDSE